jgi:hypothetical protein
MDNSPNKNCLPCKYASVVFFIALDMIISFGGGVHETAWILLQLLLGSFYVKSAVLEETKQTELKAKQIKVSTLLLCLMSGLVFRHIVLSYMLS